MKIPSYMYDTVHVLINYPQIARMLQIEATQYRAAGRHDVAQALKSTAKILKRINHDLSPAQAFDWPKREQL